MSKFHITLTLDCAVELTETPRVQLEAVMQLVTAAIKNFDVPASYPARVTSGTALGTAEGGDYSRHIEFVGRKS